MFTGIDGDGPFGGSGALKVWRSFLTDQYAKTFAKNGGIGIASHVYDPLLKQQGVKSLMSSITTTAEAEQAIEQVADLIEKLHGLIEQETELVHAGNMRKATALGPRKERTCGSAFRRRRTAEGEREISSAGRAGSVPPHCTGCRRRSAPCCRRT